MSIVGAFDVHRRQITYDWVDQHRGQVGRGRISPATRHELAGWLAKLPSRQGVFAVEACTGWRFVVEAVQQAGLQAVLAEPAETAFLRGPKRRAKTDRADARLLRELLEQQRLPCSWIPPAHLLELRELCRLRKSLLDQRTQWQQRIHALLVHHGLPAAPHGLRSAVGRAWLERAELDAASRLVLADALVQLDQADAALDPLEGWLRRYGRQQAGCQALVAQVYGVGALLAPAIVAELGDARRFSGGDQVVRYTGLDVTVWSSDTRRSPGHLSRQGPEVLRWALFEAAKCHSHTSAPEHPLYAQVKQRSGAKHATRAVARKLARQIRHVLIGLGPDALAPPSGLAWPKAA